MYSFRNLIACLNWTIAVLAFTTVHTNGQFSQCPEDASSCCQCVTKPGCAWSDSSTVTNQSRCLPFMAAAENSDISLVNDLVIPSRGNRPLNQYRKRFIRPQSGQLKMSLGLRKEIPIQVFATSRRVRLTITGPQTAPEFTIVRGDELSCARRFRLRERTTAQRQNRPSTKRVTVDCHVSAAGETEALKLVVDMNKCYTSTKSIRINIRASGARRFKLDISSSCPCPCQSGDTAGTCQDGEESHQCITEDDEGQSQCSGVNDYCRRDPNGPVCSGHGTCICGVCMCDIINSDGISTDAATPSRRYTGSYCQCDDFSCPRSGTDNLICGGTSRGQCLCGRCWCQEGLQGDACEISTSVEACLASDGSVCNNQGECVSGQCMCRDGYAGAKCEECFTCEGMCNRLAPCVNCMAFSGLENNNNQMNCSSLCSNPTISVVPTTRPLPDSAPDTADLCVMQRDDCFYEFVYVIPEENEIHVLFNTMLHCNRERDVTA